MTRRVYWDACVFIGLLNQEPGKVNDCSAVWAEAKKGSTLIYTSFLTFAEVFKAKCEDQAKPLSEDEDKRIEALLGQKWIRPVIVDERTGVSARRMMRHHTECKKPNDGVHLATAAILNVDEMHTYDGADLLKLDGKVLMSNGKPLKICRAAPIPSPPAAPDLFNQADNG